jgi:peptidoglycan/LPS O-acetylase OafA/YrhL
MAFLRNSTPNQPLAGRNSEFVPRLESLRGIAALIVAASHVDQVPIGGSYSLIASLGPGHGTVSALLSRAYISLTDGLAPVIFFFVLSGFVLDRSLQRGPRALRPMAGRFVIARLCRIYPAVVASVALYAAAGLLTGIGQPITFRIVIANMLLWSSSLNGVMWTLQLEVLAIPLILGAYLLRQRSGVWGSMGVAAIALLLVALSFVGTWNRLLGPQGPALALLYAFLFGMLASDLAPRFQAALARRSGSFTAAFWIFVFFAARPLLGPVSNWRFILEAAAATALVIQVSAGPPARLLSFLDRPPVHFLGRVSYSFYLLHPLGLFAIGELSGTWTRLVQAGVPTLALAFLLFVLSAAVAAALAAAFRAWIERPGVALGRRLISRSLGPAPSIDALKYRS